MTKPSSQLILLDTPPDWRLDERTRRVGRAGIAQARAALQAGRRSRSPGDPDHQPGPDHRPGPGHHQPQPARGPVPHRRQPARRPAARRPAA